MGQSLSNKCGKKPILNDHRGLVLYYHPFSYYSQKVLFVLHEKNIPCTLYEVDVSNGEQCTDWFLELNPKFDVPVLRNDTFIIPSSGQIISYLESNFYGEKHVELLPTSAKQEVLTKIVYFHRRIGQLPIGAISLGSFIHSDIVSRPKLPFIGPLRAGFLQSEEKILIKLEKYAEQNPLYKDALLAKVKMHKEKQNVIKDPEEFQKLIDAIECLLADIELELEQQIDASNKWLCCDDFTIADISLGVLLHRLSILGLENRFWANGRKPLLGKYFLQIGVRQSFQQSLPSTSSTIKTVWSKLPQTYKLYAFGVAAIIAGIVIYQI